MRRINLILTGLLLLLGAGLSLTTPVHAQDTPAAVVEAFLGAWNDADYARMYGLLSPRSQEITAQQVFELRYQQTADIVGITGIDYTVRDTRLQGTSAEVDYGVTIVSEIFESIPDPDRMMRLVQTDGAWGIAWTTMDIFYPLAGDATLTTAGETQTRANIYDRGGQPLVQAGGTMIVMYGAQQNMSNVDDCIDLLAEVMRVSRPSLVTRFAGYSANPESVFYLGEVDSETFLANRDNLLAICGVDQNNTNLVFTRETRRYLGANAATHVTGYVGQIQADQLDFYQARGYDAGALVGQTALEAQFETVLAGQPERVLRIVEPGGTTLRELAGTSGTSPTPIALTIDRRLQLITAQAMSDAFNYASCPTCWGGGSIATGGAAVVLDMNTGAILALVSYPLVNAQLFNPDLDQAVADRGTMLQQLVADPRRPLNNRATQEQYFPGSVFKIITMAAVLNEGIVTPGDTFDCELEWVGTDLGDTLPSRTDWRVIDGLEAAGPVSPAQALMASCNPFFWEFGALLHRQTGAETLLGYAERMGMHRTYRANESGIPGITGTMVPAASISEGINNAIGQGDQWAFPPIQMAVVVSAVANGGTVYNPYVVQQIGGFDGTEVSESFGPEVIGTLDFNDGVLETIRAGMCGVIADTEYGTADWVFEGAPYTACGKTGTAEAGLYPNAWFVAYVPDDIAIVVMVESSREGSEIAAPIVRRILDNYFNVFREDFPFFWTEEYIPLNIPEGSTAG